MKGLGVSRPYFFEVFTIVNLIVIQVALRRISFAPMQSIALLVPAMVGSFLLQTLIGVAIRAAIAWRRGNAETYLTIIRSPAWISDTLRFAVFSGLFVHTYGWIKLAIPLLNTRLYDAELATIGQAVFFGHSPGLLFLSLFSAPPVLRAIDWSYAAVFIVSLNIAGIFFASSPSRRLRVAFMDSNVLLWLIGAWLYVAVPSLGPAYRYPETYLPLAPLLPQTQHLQRLLMTNYQNVLLAARGIRRPVNIFFGIAGFPSLHVAFQTLVFFWMRRLWIYGEFVFGIFVLVIFIGSIVTGWHFFIDSLGGVVLAWLCYAVSFRAHRMNRWLAIHGRI